MLFSSPIFLFAFLPVTLAGYYLLDRKFKNIFLLIMSLIFYAWGEPKFIFIMLISIMANWLFGLAVDKFRDNKRAAHGYLTLMVLWNVSIFFVYKYLNFTITNVNALFGTTFPLTKFVLPLSLPFRRCHMLLTFTGATALCRKIPLTWRCTSLSSLSSLQALL